MHTTTEADIERAGEDMTKAIKAVEHALKDMGPAMCIIVLASRKNLPSVGNALIHKDIPLSEWVPMTVMIGAAQSMLIKMTEVGTKVMGDDCLKQILEVTNATPINRTIHIDN